MTNEELDALVALIEGIKIDMMQRAVRALTALRADRDGMRAAIFGSGDYCKTLRNGNFVEMAQATEAGRKGAVARAEAAEARALAAEAAALELAAKMCWSQVKRRAYQIKGADEGVQRERWVAGRIKAEELAKSIEALITPEGRTALDAALADARKDGKLEGLREAAQTADDWFYDPRSGEVTDRRLGNTLRAIAARVEVGAE